MATCRSIDGPGRQASGDKAKPIDPLFTRTSKPRKNERRDDNGGS